MTLNAALLVSASSGNDNLILGLGTLVVIVALYVVAEFLVELFWPDEEE